MLLNLPMCSKHQSMHCPAAAARVVAVANRAHWGWGWGWCWWLVLVLAAARAVAVANRAHSGCFRSVTEIRRLETAGMQCLAMSALLPCSTSKLRVGRVVEKGAENAPLPRGLIRDPFSMP